MIGSKVSIVIPVYNSEKTIKETLESIKKQSYSSFETIIVDDGSNDNSYEECLLSIKDDKRFTLIRQNNQGVSAARNLGIEKATGKYVLFVDSDDVLPSNAIERMVIIADKYRTDLVCGSFRYLKDFGRYKDVKYPNKVYNHEKLSDYIYDVTNTVSYAPWAKLFSLCVLKEYSVVFPEGVPCGEDGIFFLHYLCYAKTIVTTRAVVYYYKYYFGSSGARKFYPDYNYYCWLTSEMRMKTCALVGNQDYSSTIQTSYLQGCINYYILRMKKHKHLLRKIQESFCMFPNAVIDSKVMQSYKKRHWNRFLLLWVFHYYKSFALDKAKLLFYSTIKR